MQHVVSETLLLRDIRTDLEVALEARRRVLERAAPGACGPVTAFVEQSPLHRTPGKGASLELAVLAVVPKGQPLRSPSAVSGSGAQNGHAGGESFPTKLVRIGGQTHLHAGNIHGSGTNAFEEAYSMFCAAEVLLQNAGMGLGEVIRTWIYLRDMDRDYDEFNRARREFFRSRGLALKPASTAVGGAPSASGHDFSLRLYAVKSPRPLAVEVMSAATLNEAWTYGSDFSRGLKVEDANKIALYISGTASVDEAGDTVHVGDVEAQARRMLMNIAALLASHGASFDDLVSAIAYVKNPDDAQLVRAVFHEQGFEGFPCTIVQAPICRPELLCETEAVAVLPLRSSEDRRD